MAPRSFWTGYLKLSLVTCAVSMTPATTESEKIRFHIVNRQTGNRIESRDIDAQTGQQVAPEDVARAYPRGEDDFVILEEDELDAIKLASTRTIEITSFVPNDEIPWIWYDRPHYLTPSDQVGEEAFAIIREAMEKLDVLGIARLVLYRREHLVMLKPRGKGIVLWTLRYGDEVKDEKDYFKPIAPAKPDPAALQLMSRLIEQRTQAWSPDLVEDPVQDKLRDLIAGKRKRGKKTPPPVKKAAAPVGGNVVNIMDALRRSIASEK